MMIDYVKIVAVFLSQTLYVHVRENADCKRCMFNAQYLRMSRRICIQPFLIISGPTNFMANSLMLNVIFFTHPLLIW